MYRRLLLVVLVHIALAAVAVIVGLIAALVAAFHT
jgi:hypothetical protein